MVVNPNEARTKELKDLLAQGARWGPRVVQGLAEHNITAYFGNTREVTGMSGLATSINGKPAVAIEQSLDPFTASVVLAHESLHARREAAGEKPNAQALQKDAYVRLSCREEFDAFVLQFLCVRELLASTGRDQLLCQTKDPDLIGAIQLIETLVPPDAENVPELFQQVANLLVSESYPRYYEDFWNRVHAEALSAVDART
jgi:hypothetical protein